MNPEDQRRLAYLAQQKRQAAARTARERAMVGNPAVRRDLAAAFAPLLPGPGVLGLEPSRRKPYPSPNLYPSSKTYPTGAPQ